MNEAQFIFSKLIEIFGKQNEIIKFADKQEKL